MSIKNIPGVSAEYIDGAFRNTPVSTAPRILILGTASTGESYEVYSVADTSAAEVVFGSDSELIRVMHEALTQGAENIGLMRIGGSPGSFSITDDATSKVLTIETGLNDEHVLDRYVLIIEPSSLDTSVSRILLFDVLTLSYVYDSDEIKAVDTGIVAVTGGSEWPVGSTTLQTDGSTELTSNDIVEGVFPDFAPRIGSTAAVSLPPEFSGVTTPPVSTLELSGVVDAPTRVEGTDGVAISNVERYAALEFAYQLLDFRDGDFVIPCGAYHDAPNIVTGTEDSDGNWSTLGAGSAADVSGITLGAAVKAAPPFAGVTSPYGFVSALQADSEDDYLGYLWQYRYKGKIYSFFADNLTLASANIIGHNTLTGETVPAAVYTKFNAATASQFRECSFTHQLASFCHRASTSWSTMLGIISTKPPAGFERKKLRNRAGELPTYTIKGSDRVIDTAGDNGTGLLGDKFLAGEAGYRNAAITAADKDVGDGYGLGGLILTKGSGLPNSEPYGIDDTDEAIDKNGRPIDIGKHVLITYDWPLVNSSYKSRLYTTCLPGILAGKLAAIPENIEPIGSVNGAVGPKVIASDKWSTSQISDLSFIRAIGLRRDEDTGQSIIVQCKTAAHPSSDFSRISTIRSVNRTLTGIRRIAKPYIGTPFSSTRLLSLQQAIDEFLRVERVAGFNQGAVCTISYTRADRIVGKLTLKLKMIPPFSLETINIETSLAADESELS